MRSVLRAVISRIHTAWVLYSAMIDSLRIKMNPMSWFLSRMLGVLNMAYGIAMIIGGPQRWSYQTYHVLAQLPGAPYSWGIILLFLSTCTFAGQVARKSAFWYRLRNFGFILITVWWLVFDFCIWLAISPGNSVPYAAGVGALFPALLAIGMFPIDERVRLDDAQIFAKPVGLLPPAD